MSSTGTAAQDTEVLCAVRNKMHDDAWWIVLVAELLGMRRIVRRRSETHRRPDGQTHWRPLNKRRVRKLMARANQRFAWITALFMCFALVSCTTYTGITRDDGVVYLTGTNNYFFFGTTWVKRCTEVGGRLLCEDLPVGDGAVPTIGQQATQTRSASAPRTASPPAASPRPEPHRLSLSGSSGPQAFEVTSGGRVVANIEYGEGCFGYLPLNPNAVLEVASRGRLVLGVRSAEADDTTMVVVGPDGTHCGDDENGLNPEVVLQASPGTYSVYVGSRGFSPHVVDLDVTFTVVASPTEVDRIRF